MLDGFVMSPAEGLEASTSVSNRLKRVAECLDLPIREQILGAMNTRPRDSRPNSGRRLLHAARKGIPKAYTIAQKPPFQSL